MFETVLSVLLRILLPSTLEGMDSFILQILPKMAGVETIIDIFACRSIPQSRAIFTTLYSYT